MGYRKVELTFSAVFFLLGMLLFIHTFDSAYAVLETDLSKGPVFFPRIVLTVWMGCSLAIFINAFFKKDSTKEFLWGKVLPGWHLIGVFVLLYDLIGFIAAGLIFFFSMALFMGYRNTKILIPTVFSYVLILYFIFTRVLGFVLPGLPGLGG